jgi:hypothetical protein
VPDWTTWGDGPLRQGTAASSALTAATAGKLRLAWSRPIGGTGASQPLSITDPVSGTRLYVVASESGRVSAFGAGDGRTVWTRELGAISTACSQLPGGQFGITGTPVYDPTSHVLYVEAVDQVFALDVHTGGIFPGWPLKLPIDRFYEPVWGALALRGTSLYIATASYCDRKPYQGRVLDVDVATRTVASQWVTVPGPTAGGGGIWGWGGVSITPDGHVWAATANANGTGLTDDATGNAESVVELTPDLQTIQVGPAPGMPHHGDFGFGSTPVVFTPRGCQTMVAAEGKDGIVYLYRRQTLSKGPVQRLLVAYPATLYGLPAWDARTQRMFVTTSTGINAVTAGLHAIGITPGCTLRNDWTLRLDSQLDSTPTVANDTAVVATGSGKLVVASTRTAKRLITLPLGGAAFVAPTVVGSDVVVPTWKGRVLVFRLPPAAAKR